MTEAHGIGRRCEIKASCFQEAFKAIFETSGSKISHETPQEAAGGLTTQDQSLYIIFLFGT